MWLNLLNHLALLTAYCDVINNSYVTLLVKTNKNWVRDSEKAQRCSSYWSPTLSSVGVWGLKLNICCQIGIKIKSVAKWLLQWWHTRPRPDWHKVCRTKSWHTCVITSQTLKISSHLKYTEIIIWNLNRFICHFYKKISKCFRNTGYFLAMNSLCIYLRQIFQISFYWQWFDNIN